MEEMKLTPAQKAGRTNHARAEARKARRNAERMAREDLRATLMGIVNNCSATISEKIEASRLLMELDAERHY